MPLFIKSLSSSWFTTGVEPQDPHVMSWLKQCQDFLLSCEFTYEGMYNDSFYKEELQIKTNEEYQKGLKELMDKPVKLQNARKTVLVLRELRRHEKRQDYNEQVSNIRNAYLDSDRYKSDFKTAPVSDNELLGVATVKKIFQFKYEFEVNEKCFIRSHIYDKSLYFHIESPQSCPRWGKYMFNKMVVAYRKNKVPYNKIVGEWLFGDNLGHVNRVILDQKMDICDAVKTTWTGKLAQKYGFTQTKVVREIKDIQEKEIVECVVEFSKPEPLYYSRT
jgi:hypothetical protein